MEVRINNYSVKCYAITDALSVLFQSIPPPQYSPYPTLKENIMCACDIVVEFLGLLREEVKAKEKTQLTRLQNRILRYKKQFSRIESHQVLVNYYYSFLLAMEELSTLSGFGFSNKFGDRLSGNPERQSIYK